MPDTPKTLELPPELAEAIERAIAQRVPDPTTAQWVADDVCDELAPLLAERWEQLTELCRREMAHHFALPDAELIDRAHRAEAEARVLREALEAEGQGEGGGFHRGDHTLANGCEQCRALVASPTALPSTANVGVGSRPATEPEQQEVVLGDGDLLYASPAELAEDVSRAHEVLDEMGAPHEDAGPCGAVYSLPAASASSPREGADTTEVGKYGRNFREAIEHIHQLPPSERSAMSNRAASSSSSGEGERRPDGDSWTNERVARHLAGRFETSGSWLEVAYDARSIFTGYGPPLNDDLTAPKDGRPPAPPSRVRDLRERLTSDEAVEAAARAMHELFVDIDPPNYPCEFCPPRARHVLAAVADYLEQREETR